MKKVEINAQVTAIITFVESIGNLFMVLLLVIRQFTAIATSIFLMLNFIVLPITFLINTRENKVHVAQQGWSSILRNARCRMDIVLPTLNYNKVRPFQHAKYNVKNESCLIHPTTEKGLLLSLIHI